MSKTPAALISAALSPAARALAALAVAALTLALGACASDPGASCRNVGHAPGTKAYSDCESAAAERQAQGARTIANQMPLDGYGPPMGRF